MKRPAAVDALFAGQSLPRTQRSLGEIREYIKMLERCRACKLGSEACQTCKDK